MGFDRKPKLRRGITEGTGRYGTVRTHPGTVAQQGFQTLGFYMFLRKFTRGRF